MSVRECVSSLSLSQPGVVEGVACLRQTSVVSSGLSLCFHPKLLLPTVQLTALCPLMASVTLRECQ